MRFELSFSCVAVLALVASACATSDLPQDSAPVVEVPADAAEGADGATAPPSLPGTDGAAQVPDAGAATDAGVISAHPRTIATPASLALIKQRIADHTEPQWSAFQALLSDVAAYASFTEFPPEEIYLVTTVEHTSAENTAISRAIFDAHSKRAQALALAYALTGQETYAAQSVSIMQRWQQVGTQLVGNAHAGLHAGSYLVQFMYAYDLLHEYGGWPEPDRAAFRQWWSSSIASRCRMILDEFMPGDDPAGWDGHNWDDAGVNCLMSTAAAFGDQELTEEMLTVLEKYFATDWRMSRKPYGPNGAMVSVMNDDILRNKPDQLQGVMYTGYGTSSLVQALLTAEHLGRPLWTQTTPGGATLGGVIDQWFRWNYLNADFNVHLDRQAAGVRVRKSSEHENILEVAASRMDMAPDFDAYVAAHRPVIGNPRNSYATLLHGDMP